MKIADTHSNSKGFSLVQVLMMVALISAISAGTMSMISSTMKGQKALQVNDSLKNTVAGLRQYLSKESVCTANLDNFSQKTFDRTQLANTVIGVNRFVSPEDGKVLMQDGAVLPTMSNTAVRMSIRSIQEMVPNKSYMAELAFVFDTDVGVLRNSSGPRHLLKKMVLVLETTNSGNTQTIDRCVAFDSNALAFEDVDKLNANVCAKMGGIYQNGSCNMNQTICRGAGGTWTNGSCNMDALKAMICNGMGGSFNGGGCTPPVVDVSPLVNSKPEICASLGGNWNGSSCSVPETGITQIVRTGCGAFSTTNGLGQVAYLGLTACSDGN